MTQRDTAADQLIKVIQVLQLGRKTGVLTVERGEGPTFEEGMLVFSYGNIVSAKTGYLNGIDACNQLYTWTRCKFAFIPHPQASGWDAPSAPLRQPETTPGPDHSARSAGARPSPNQGGEQAPQFPFHNEILYQKILEPAYSLQAIEAARLSRAHKHLFMLVNGERTLTEFVRLTGRQLSEIASQLTDLEQIGVIRRQTR
ncbi:DUF4388 domain-containing protein [Dictyobacter aurantiacus]|uniref:PatA-like N-terminal domain-containing protein n=1 Tax=Dictyobacter aurantiacus TaxID=1936993 RepID=A0A401ZJB1_9CHLR|nr:DUF4388 domain-containing protein [Dictyobacter aurantiacus]GCE06929.1 hypothetical protein KDAU_42580 [Dictyobacter aurantiacus]